MLEKPTSIYEDPEVRKTYKKKRFDQPFPKLSESRLPKEDREEREMKIYRGHSRAEYGEYSEAVHSPEAGITFERVCQICEEVQAAGGRAMIVGGAVRDEVLGMASKDFDVEVYGMEPATLEEIVKRFGKIKEVGKAFGILKIAAEGGLEIDISMPRTDSKIGEGHTGFDVKADPFMSIPEAARRRDFTFNALCKDPLTGEIFDAFGGVEDLRNRTLRVTDQNLFQDDPLRVLRGAQFTGRFGLTVEQASLQIMKGMVDRLKELSPDRIREEWEKMLLKSIKPSMGLNLLNNVGALEMCYPELAALRGVEQEFEWHPEGDVWTHTLMAVDAAKNVVDVEKLPSEMARVVMLSSLTHDMGKPSTTEFVNGRYRSPLHDVKGEDIAARFLESIGTRKIDIEKVRKLVKNHMWPGSLYIAHLSGEDPTDGAFRRAATRLHPATIEEITYLYEADRGAMGPYLDPRNPAQFMLPEAQAGVWVRQRAQEIGIYREKPGPLIQGRDLIALGYRPGKTFGEIIGLTEDWRDNLGKSREEIMLVLHNCKGDSATAVTELKKVL